MNCYQIEYTEHTFKGKHYYLPVYANHRPAVKHILNNQYSEPKTHLVFQNILAHYNRKCSMIHAGTFFGDMLPHFSSMTDNLVYAFEPVLENYVLSKLCIEKNQLTNVVIYNSALNDTSGNLRINTGINEELHRGGTSSIDSVGYLCSSIRIDDFQYDRLKIIHLDIEGHELPALKGSYNTIMYHRPFIFIEDNRNDCASFLESLNYSYVTSIPGLKVWSPIKTAFPPEYLL